MPRKPIPPLIAAPYAAPKCQVGRILTCTLRGEVPVDGLTDAPIPWPYTRYRGGAVPPCYRPILILCGDLERAVRTESSTAIMHYWGVGKRIVWKWRKALGVQVMNEGTMAAYRRNGATRQYSFTRLKPRQVADVRSRLARGQAPVEIERETGVSRRAVWRIRSGETFAE